MSLEDVRIIMLYSCPKKVNLMHSAKFITIILSKYTFSVPTGNKNNRVYPMSHKFWRDVQKDALIAS